jgi:hypothetical protein
VHYLLQTNGITSRGDIYLNGKLIADKDFQSDRTLVTSLTLSISRPTATPS